MLKLIFFKLLKLVTIGLSCAKCFHVRVLRVAPGLDPHIFILLLIRFLRLISLLHPIPREANGSL